MAARTGLICAGASAWTRTSRRTPTPTRRLADIEDLVQQGRAGGPCPYFLSREMAAGADLVLMPYNYLVDARTRFGMKGIQWRGSVLIFDEAHNVEVRRSPVTIARLSRHAREFSGCTSTRSVSPCLHLPTQQHRIASAGQGCHQSMLLGNRCCPTCSSRLPYTMSSSCCVRTASTGL